MSDEPTCRCRAVIDGERCDYRGTRPELSEHADEAGHPRCVCCARVLGEFETQTCEKCITAVRDDLTAVFDGCADLERRIGEGAFCGGWLNPLAMVGDGSVHGGGEDDHVRYRDPIPVVALVESWDRDWRETFGHTRPAYKPLGHPDRQAYRVLVECVAYLRRWHTLAARTHPAFDGYAAEVRAMRGLLEHVAAVALDPVRAPIPCTCGGRLEQRFGEAGLSDVRVCRACGYEWAPAEYHWRYRMLTETPGFVSVQRAAEATERSEDTIWAWVRSLDVPSACSRLGRRIVVELAAVFAKSEATPRQSRRSA